MTEPILIPLDDLSVIEFAGPDTLAFLQGQLSNDMNLLTPARPLLAGLHNPQGRCLALLHLLRPDADRVLAVVPADLADTVGTLLARRVLRAKVVLREARGDWRVHGLLGAGERQLLVTAQADDRPSGVAGSRNDWRLADIRAGIAEIAMATSGLFVAQMLNLDLIGAISYSKGCYTGQEVVARAHYRGQVKRRLQRFALSGTMPLVPGQRVRLVDGRSAQIVQSAEDGRGGQEFLAVAPIKTEAAGAEEPAAPEETVPAAELPLPYALPE